MPSTLNPNIPGGLEQIIMKGMALDLKDRYASAGEMLHDMEEFRKNPAILFDYAKPVVTDATRPMNLGGIHPTPAPRTTAQRVTQNREGGNAQRPRTGTRPQTGAPAGTRTANRPQDPQRRNPGQAPVRRRKSRQEIEAEEKKSRMTTIAIVTCSAVAVIAIGIFLIALVNGALFNQESELVEVPNLLGDIYYSGMTIDGFTIDAEHSYNDDYEKGQIFEQTPVGGIRIAKGSTIKVMVSLGSEPLVKYMENLRGQTGEDAKAFLTGQGMNPLVLDGGFDDDVAKGVVLRTEPAEGAQLTDGQTVYIYISQGPMIPMEKMPNVVGLNYATAYKQLRDAGFQNVEPKYVQSEEPKDEVVGQSVPKNTETDLTSKIVLYVSNGPEATTATTEEPTEETKATQPEPTTEPVTDPQESTKKVRIMLPEREEAYLLTIMQGNTPLREAMQVAPGTTYVEVELTGMGVQSYDVYIDDEKYQTIEVDFS